MMADTVRDAIAEYIAAEERIIDAPTEPFGYGVDVSCTTDVDRNVREVTGTLAIAQAIVRRLDTPRGTLPDDPAYGISLRSMVNTPQTTSGIRAIAGRIHNEVIKDDRIETLSVKVVPTSTGDALALTLIVTPADVLESFTMTLAVTSGAILLEAIS